VFQWFAQSKPDMEIYCCPNWLLKRLPLKPIQQVHAGYFLSALLAMAFVFLVQWIPHVCLMRICFGLPCPGCGITHSLRALFAGQWHASWTANPAGITIALCFIFQVIARPLAILNSTCSVPTQWGSRILGTVAFGTILIHWFWQLLFS
jgi:Protein of unknown function (DUF2752)